jgi:hypothetical protein
MHAAGAYAFSALFFAVDVLAPFIPNKVVSLDTSRWSTVGIVLPTSITALSNVTATTLIAYKTWYVFFTFLYSHQAIEHFDVGGSTVAKWYLC